MFVYASWLPLYNKITGWQEDLDFIFPGNYPLTPGSPSWEPSSPLLFEIGPATDRNGVFPHSYHQVLPYLHTQWHSATNHLLCREGTVIQYNQPYLQGLYVSRILRHMGKIEADPSQSGHKVFETLHSGTRLQSIKTKISQKKFFFSSANGLINKVGDVH